MREPFKVLERLRAKGEEVFAQVSGELMANPRFVKAMETAFKGKARLDEAVGRALKTANIPTRTEFKKAVRRVEALEAELAELKAAAERAKKAARRGAAPAKTTARKPARGAAAGTGAAPARKRRAASAPASAAMAAPAQPAGEPPADEPPPPDVAQE